MSYLVLKSLSHLLPPLLDLVLLRGERIQEAREAVEAHHQPLRRHRRHPRRLRLHLLLRLQIDANNV